MQKKYIFQPIFIALLVIAGVLLGYKIFKNQHQSSSHHVVLTGGGKVQQVMALIMREYVDSIDFSMLEEAAIIAILDSLDPHSTYIKSEDLKEVNEPLDGKFGGIGIQFNMQKDTVIIIKTIPNGPSEKIGLLAGDRIITINDSIVAGVNMPTNEIVSQLKGEKGTRVKVGIKRSGVDELIDFQITRDDIPLYSVDIAYMLNEEVGYIKISNFSRTTYDEFMQAGKKLNKKGIQKMVLDLRGNGGGYMSAAVNIADQFLGEGNLIVYTDGRSMERQDLHASKRGMFIDLPVVVLIDEWSASASEIIAGAIQDNDRGTIVGRRSFGKGMVQQQWMLSDGSALRLTVARYYTPTGRCIQKPYHNGEEEYYGELGERFLHGEFFESDSIQFYDSVEYVTPGGRILYGGGGIMPDIFVPHDTMGITDYYKTISVKGLIYRFTFSYTDKHREELSKFNTASQLQRELRRRDILNQFISFAKEEGIKKPSPDELNTMRDLLQTQLEAYLARNILDNEGFYPIIHEIDQSLKIALETFREK